MIRLRALIKSWLLRPDYMTYAPSGQCKSFHFFSPFIVLLPLPVNHRLPCARVPTLILLVNIRVVDTSSGTIISTSNGIIKTSTGIGTNQRPGQTYQFVVHYFVILDYLAPGVAVHTVCFMFLHDIITFTVMNFLCQINY